MSQLFDALESRAWINSIKEISEDHGYKTKNFAVKIPIILTGGVGDVIMALSLVQKIKELCGPVEVYCNHPHVYNIFHAEDEAKHSSQFPHYDYWMVINSIVRFKFGTNFRGFRNEAMLKLFLKYIERAQDWDYEIKCHPHLDNRMGQKAKKLGLTRWMLPWHLLGLEYTPHKEVKMAKEVESKYITVHQGFETAMSKQIHGRSTKNWPRANWNRFVKEFKLKRPDIKIIQLGAVTGQDIDGVDHNFRNKLKLEQSFTVLAGSLCHVDGDSGLVHAARLFGVKSVVMFGSTPRDFFGYSENTNLKGDGCPEGGGCWWLSRDWLKKCAIGMTSVPCMNAIRVETVLDAVLKVDL